MLDSLQCLINSYILITEQLIWVNIVKRRQMLINWLGLKGLSGVVIYVIMAKILHAF